MNWLLVIYYVGFVLHGIVITANAILHKEEIMEEGQHWTFIIVFVLMLVFWFINLPLMVGVTLAHLGEIK